MYDQKAASRFAILNHDHPFLHWDLLLEDGDRCRTWRLLAEPNVSMAINVERIADHRLLYLDYEGPVSGDRGTVSQFDGGRFAWLHDSETSVEVELHGRRSTLICTLSRSDEDHWTARFREQR